MNRPLSRPLAALLFVVILLGAVALPGAALADLPPPEPEGAATPAAQVADAVKAPSGIEKVLAQVDAKFGAWFVGPLASVFFFDLWFWDNQLAPEQAVGQPAKNGMIITAYEGGEFKGIAQETVAKAALVPAFVRGVTIPYGGVRALVVEDGPKPRGIVEGGALPRADVERQRHLVVPYAGYEGPPITLQGGPAAPAEAVVVQGLAPAPVLAVPEGEDLKLLPTIVPLEKLAVPFTAGTRAFHGDKPALVVKVEGDLVTVSTGEPVVIPQGEVDLANKRQVNLAFIVFWLVVGAVFLTLRMGFINLRGFVHALKVTRGDFDDEGDPGEISHFQALSSALSATVGLGNIAGVAIAVATGGPGAIFWMIVAGFLGMSSKFTECTLGLMYRHVDAKGIVSGGPMRYLEAGLKERGFGGLGKVLAVGFAVMCIGGSFGGGNMFQANQAFAAVAERIPALQDASWAFGLVLAVLVGLVIIGGIKRIGAAASFLVPAMCGIYLLAGVWILLANASHIPDAIGTILGSAFTMEAGFGGFVGTLITGFQRAAFSNEAGVGSASIAHAAASTDEPVREGVVALLEPFIDTIVVCTMTGLVVVITNAYQQDTGDGVLMTSYAFGSVISWFPWVLSVAVLLFAFSTMISWSYYGERCFTLLFGEKTSMLYRFIFCFFVFFGCVFKLGNVLDFSDLAVLGMAFPNILGIYFLSGKVRAALDDYWARLHNGQMPSNRG